MRLGWCFVWVALLLCSCLTACTTKSEFSWTVSQTEPPAQTAPAMLEDAPLRLSMPSSGGKWDPLVNASQAMQGLMQLVYEPFVRLDNALKPAASLAESWETDQDGTTWIFHLRKGVFFHDGSALTAKDVVKTLDLIKAQGEAGPYGWILSPLASWKATDDQTVTIVTNQVGYQMLYAMVFPVIRQQNEGFPVGTGPYEVVQYTAGKKLDLKAFGNWWRQSPKISSIVVVAKDSMESELATMSLGELDVLRTKVMSTDPYRQVGVTTTKDYSTQGYDALFFNFRRPLMADARIRSAVASAIDRKDLISNMYQNHAVASDVAIPPDSWLHEVRLPGYVFNPIGAFTILEDMGFIDVDGDGIFDLLPGEFRLENPSMEEVDLSASNALLAPLVILTNYDQENYVRRDAALRIAEQLKSMGLPVKVDAVDKDQLAARLELGDYDFALLGYQIPLSCDLTFLLSSAYTGEIGGYAATHYSSEVLEDLLKKPALAKNDSAYRSAVLAIEEHLLKELPYIGLYFRNGTLISKDNLWMPYVVREDKPFVSVEEWYFVAK